MAHENEMLSFFILARRIIGRYSVVLGCAPVGPTAKSALKLYSIDSQSAVD